jgi:RimJ/RimL family protein N-acetyltransferase
LDRPVAVGALEVTRDDNLAFIEGSLFVDPTERRQGYGSATLAELEACARELRRPTLVVFVIEGSGEIGVGPNRSFAAHHDYRVAEENVRRDLAWPRPQGELDQLWDAWVACASDYEIIWWTNATPEELVDARAHLSAIMPAETPHVDIDVEAEHWDAERVRRHEATTNLMGRDLLVAAARHRTSGELVGYSELTVSRNQPQTAYQWDTLVVRKHRGHRLGGLLKIATMRLLEAGQYPTEKVTTFNSTLNTPMIAVNEALGARVAGAMVAWRKDL